MQFVSRRTVSFTELKWVGEGIIQISFTFLLQVLSVEESVSTVRFIDYGNTEQKTLKEIFRLIYTYFLQFA